MKSGLYTAKGPKTCQKRAASCLHETIDAKTWAVSHADGGRWPVVGGRWSVGCLVSVSVRRQGIGRSSVRGWVVTWMGRLRCDGLASPGIC